jgi:hypothetical protein
MVLTRTVKIGVKIALARVGLLVQQVSYINYISICN